MSEGVVPDSDPIAPPLDPLRPEWVAVGNLDSSSWYDEPMPDVGASEDEPPETENGSIETGSTRTPLTRELMSSPLISPAGDATTPLSPPDQHAQVQPSETSTLPASVELDASGTQAHIPPRRRFNFESWVRSEKRAHEKVYHRRYEVFHGANSDSEDDDYGELDTADLDDSQEAAPPLGSDETGLLDRSATQHKEASDDSEPDQSQVAPRRSRLHIIDSESETEESSSDSESITSSTASLVPIFEKRLTKAIPASHRVHPIESPDSQPDSQSDSQSQPHSSFPGIDLSQSLPQLTIDDMGGDNFVVKDVAPIDYMLSRREAPRQRKSSASRSRDLAPTYKPVSIDDLARKAGPRASKALRIAARTARNTSSKSGKPPRDDNPLSKVFVGPTSRDAVRTLRHWREGTLKFGNRRPAAQKPRNTRPRPSSEVKTPLLSAYEQHHLVPQSKILKTKDTHSLVLPATSSSKSAESSISKRKKRKSVSSKRRAPEPNPLLYHPTILQREVPGRRTIYSSYHPKPPSLPVQTRVTDYNAAKLDQDSFNFGSSDRLHIDLNSPNQRFILHRFGKSTFIGSNTLDLLECLTVWNGETVTDQTFGTPLDGGDEAAATRDAEHLLATCEVNRGIIDAALFDQIYEYFLKGVAYLCDESQIVEARFREHIYRQWLRLSRSLLKLSLQRSYESTAVPLISQLVSLSTAIVAKRLSVFSSIDFLKSSLLVSWTVYYHQASIATQVENQSFLEPRHCVGAELVYTGIRLKCFDSLPKVFAKHGKASGKWHMLLLLSSFKSPEWSNWELARSLVALKPIGVFALKPEDARVATESIMLLITKWRWPPSAEIIIDLFNFYAKQQHYADPRGESIWLPEFLLRSNFDGTSHPDQDFSMFLELLGCTLSRFSNDLPVARRISGRVTPLSAVSFPETKEVSLADLSSASHQYSILIVLLRMSPPGSKPSVTQFRDLVRLKDAHLAIRIKAVSAWSIVSRIAVDRLSAMECRSWLRRDILRDEFPPPQLLLVSLRCAADVAPVSLDAVPTLYLLEMGLRSVKDEVRAAVWTLLARVRPANRLELLARLDSFEGEFNHLGESDIASFAKLAYNTPELVDKWPNTQTRPVVVAHFIQSKAVSSNHSIVRAYLMKSLIRATWSNEDTVLLAAAGYNAQSEVGDRQAALRSIFRQSVSADFAKVVLDMVKREWEAAVKGGSAVRLAYKAVVAQVRQLIFEQWPDLSESSTWFDDSGSRSIELAQLNISKFVSQGRNFEGEFFFAYKLRRSLETDGGETMSEEIVAALSLSNSEKAQKWFNFVVNELFAFYFCISTQHFAVMEPVMPTLVRSARMAMCQGSHLQYNPAPMLLCCLRYMYVVLHDQLSYNPGDFASLLYEVYVLAYCWLHQVASSGNEALYDGVIIGLWTFGKRFHDSGFAWWRIDLPVVESGPATFDIGAVVSALKGVSRSKLEIDSQKVERLFKQAWAAFDKLVRCYECVRRDGVDENVLQWTTDPCTLERTQRPPTE